MLACSHRRCSAHHRTSRFHWQISITLNTFLKVRMPKTCGTGPYSRIHSFEEADDETILPDEHAAALPTGGKVYRVKFDYSFDAIPESNGPV
jgi:ligand-binding SRPBCC domain-containing protein